MIATATIRQVAVNCETRKVAYRQTKDGVVVSFVIHPQEVPDQLALAPLGTRYVLALVEIGDDEKPKQSEVPTRTLPSRRESMAQSDVSRDGAGQTLTGTHKIPKAWDSLPLSQQAGIRCNDPAFWKFLRERYKPPFETLHIDDADTASECVRLICGGIASRSDLKPDGMPGRAWQQLDAQYRAWQREAEIVPA